MNILRRPPRAQGRTSRPASRPRARRIGATLAALAVATGVTVAGASHAGAVSAGPVINEDFADPSVMHDSNTYYGYATNADGRHIKWATSNDLYNWQVQGSDALPTLGAWADPNWVFTYNGKSGGGVWAPDVFNTGNGYTMYYVAHDRASDKECVGAARSGSPAGPFVPFDTPIVCTPQTGGTIDPSDFSENGQHYILWKNDGNCCNQDTWLHIQPVNGDGTQTTGPDTPLIKQDRAYEGALVEAPKLVKHGGTYVLFYSANFFGNDSYVTSYAHSGNLFGPYDKAPDPLMSTYTFSGTVRGPGGEDIVTGPDGKDKIVFHGWDAGYNYRAMYVADLGWANDYPVVRGSRVRYEAENGALTDCAARDAGGGASNGRVVGHIDNDDSRVAITVYAPRSGTYRVSTRFANGSGTGASHRLWVNGNDAGTVDYPNTGWDNWQVVERNVDLNEGFNTLTYGKGANYAELDGLEID